MNIITTNTTEVKYGPHYNPQFREYEVWHQGTLIAWCSTQTQAFRSYHEILSTHHAHLTRNPVNGTNGDTPPPDWASCPDCGKIIDYDDFCPTCEMEVVNE